MQVEQKSQLSKWGEFSHFLPNVINVIKDKDVLFNVAFCIFFLFLFDVTEAVVVSCGSPKKRPVHRP